MPRHVGTMSLSRAGLNVLPDRQGKRKVRASTGRRRTSSCAMMAAATTQDGWYSKVSHPVRHRHDVDSWRMVDGKRVVRYGKQAHIMLVDGARNLNSLRPQNR